MKTEFIGKKGQIAVTMILVMTVMLGALGLGADMAVLYFNWIILRKGVESRGRGQRGIGFGGVKSLMGAKLSDMSQVRARWRDVRASSVALGAIEAQCWRAHCVDDARSVVAPVGDTTGDP